MSTGIEGISEEEIRIAVDARRRRIESGKRTAAERYSSMDSEARKLWSGKANYSWSRTRKGPQHATIVLCSRFGSAKARQLLSQWGFAEDIPVLDSQFPPT